jgi:hypothetical protein
MPSSEPRGKWFGAYKTPGNSHAAGDNLGVFVIHAVMLHTGKVLWWSGHAETIHYIAEAVMWDPLAAAVNDPTVDAVNVHGSATMPDISNATIITFPGVDIFCCHHVHAGDGKVITMGGAGAGTGTAAHNSHGRGIKDINMFDPDNPSAGFVKLGDMTEARWYPTAVFMDDENILVFSGRKEVLTGSYIAESVEMLVAGSYGTARTVTMDGVHKAQAAAFATYPGLHLVQGSDVFHTGTNWRYESSAQPTALNGVPTVSYKVTANSTASTRADCLAYPRGAGFFEPTVKNREEGTSILLSPAQDGKILLVGGARMPANGHADPPRAASFRANHPLVAGSNPKSAEILDTKVLPYVWTPVPDMTHARINVNAVTLVDGRVLVLGGHDLYKWCPASVMALECEIFDPVTRTWSLAASLHAPRIYHCAALLLPDGSVIVGGGVDPNFDEPGNAGMALNQKTFEIYKPSYLFLSGSRPVITTVKNERGVEKQIVYGRPFFIETPQVNDIRSVVIIRPGAMTHHTDTEQRHIPLEFVKEEGKLRVTMINDRSVAPPGMYMLFIIDNFEEGRPCEKAVFVLLTSNIASITASPKKSCIIATVCFESSDHPKVQLLRNIRDIDMSTTGFGKQFVHYLNRWYYSFSPAVASYLGRHQTLRSFTRVMVIRPIIAYMQLVKKMTERLTSDTLKSMSLIIAFMALLMGAVITAAWLINWCYQLFIYYLNQ